MAELVPVFVFHANLYARPGSIFIVITSFIVALHLPVTTDRTMIPVVSIIHPPHTFLVHAPHPVGITLRSPIATHPGILC
jgi:hypothetical protein